MSFWCQQIDQKNNEIFVRISAQASKERLTKKVELGSQNKIIQLVV